MQEADSSLIIIYKATLVRIANKCFLHDHRVRRENRKCASISISIYSFKVQLTHRNMITKIKQMIKKKNDKENRSTATESV